MWILAPLRRASRGSRLAGLTPRTLPVLLVVLVGTGLALPVARAQGEPAEAVGGRSARSAPPADAPPSALPPPLPPALPPPPLYVEPAAPGAPPQPVPANTPPVTVSPPTSGAAGTVPTPVRAPLRHVPLGGSLTVGWTYTPSNSLPLSTATNVYTPSGVDLDARFGWQIGGIDAGWPSWVGFMAGFFYYVGDQGVSDSLGIDYGIFLKHALFPGQRIRLFIGYGLGVAQVWVKGLGGHGIGHETRLAVGLDTRLSAKVHFTVEFAYKLIMLPSFAVGEAEAASYNFQAVNLMAGLWFGR